MNELVKNAQRSFLCQLRSKLCGRLHLQPFKIYTDKTVEDLILAQPKSIEELANVKGFPKDGFRIKGFGEAIIYVFNNTDKVASIDILESNDGNLEVKTSLKDMGLF